MDKEQIKMILDNPLDLDDTSEDSYSALVTDFFSKQMRWFMIMVWIFSGAFMILCVVCAVMFFMSDQARYQIMYATLFTIFALCISVMKVIAYIMVSRLNLKREIKRLELRIAELTALLKTGSA